MRPKLNRVTWKAIHIDITIATNTLVQAGSSASDMTKDEFFDEVVQYLEAAGYTPRLPVSQMKIAFKSPYSNSEYYTFLKIEGELRLKVVLDIRLTDHYHFNDRRRYTERERHLHHMKIEELPKIQQERGLNTDSADLEFVDVNEQHIAKCVLIDVDGRFFNSYEEALDEVKSRIDELP